MNDMRSMLNHAVAAGQSEKCGPIEDVDTIDYQLGRLAAIATAIQCKVSSLAAKIGGENTRAADCDRPKPAAVAGAIAMVSGDLEVTAKDLEMINDVLNRQLGGNWRLE